MTHRITRRAAFAAPIAFAAPLSVAAGTAAARPVADSAGVVEALNGSVRRADAGGRDALRLRDAVFRGDRIAAANESRAALRMADGSSLSVGSGAELTIDDFVYAPERGEGSLIASIKVGAFRYVSGQVAKIRPENIAFKMPVATIGVRGTAFVAIAEPNLAGCIVLLPSPDGRPSAIVVTTDAGEVVVDQPYTGVEVKGMGMAPTRPAPWPEARLNQMLGFIDG